MSQRKKTYTEQELIDELRAMDAQIIHGSDIFKQCAEMLESKRATIQELEGRIANALL